MERGKLQQLHAMKVKETEDEEPIKDGDYTCRFSDPIMLLF